MHVPRDRITRRVFEGSRLTHDDGSGIGFQGVVGVRAFVSDHANDARQWPAEGGPVGTDQDADRLTIRCTFPRRSPAVATAVPEIVSVRESVPVTAAAAVRIDAGPVSDAAHRSTGRS